MTITPSKVVLFDTSTLVRMANAFASSDYKRREVMGQLSALACNNVWLGLSSVHLHELIRTTNTAQFEARRNFLASLSHAAFVYSSHGVPGSLHNIADIEIRRILAEPGLTRNEIVESIRNEGSAWHFKHQPFVEFAPETWEDLRNAAQNSIDIERETESIVRLDPKNMNELRLKDVVESLRNPVATEEIDQESFIADMTSGLQKHGDKKLHCPEIVANAFVNDALVAYEHFRQHPNGILAALVEKYRIPSHYIDMEMTIEEFTRLCTLSNRLNWLASRTGDSIGLESIGLDAIPAFHFECLVRKRLLQLDRAEGSNAGDMMILPLALYADCVEVDKRVWDCCRQVARDNVELQSVHAKLIKNTGSYEHSLDNARKCLGLDA